MHDECSLIVGSQWRALVDTSLIDIQRSLFERWFCSRCGLRSYVSSFTIRARSRVANRTSSLRLGSSAEKPWALPAAMLYGTIGAWYFADLFISPENYDKLSEESLNIGYGPSRMSSW